MVDASSEHRLRSVRVGNPTGERESLEVVRLAVVIARSQIAVEPVPQAALIDRVHAHHIGERELPCFTAVLRSDPQPPGSGCGNRLAGVAQAARELDLQDLPAVDAACRAHSIAIVPVASVSKLSWPRSRPLTSPVSRSPLWKTTISVFGAPSAAADARTRRSSGQARRARGAPLRGRATDDGQSMFASLYKTRRTMPQPVGRPTVSNATVGHGS